MKRLTRKDIAKEAGAKIVGTGRSDFPNQVNNVIAFPGIFKGALEGRAKQITEEMKMSAALAIAGLVPENELNEENILPQPFDPQVADGAFLRAQQAPQPFVLALQSVSRRQRV